MAKEPSQRYGTIGEMLADLQRVRADRARTEPVAAASVTVVEPGPHPDHPGEATAGERTAHDPDEETTIVAQLPAEEEMKQALVGAGAAGLEATIVRASRTESEAGQADGTSPEEEDEQVPAKKKKRRSLAFRIVLGLVIFLSFTSGAVWAGLSFFDRLFPEDVVVPEVLGMTVEQARRIGGARPRSEHRPGSQFGPAGEYDRAAVARSRTDSEDGTPDRGSRQHRQRDRRSAGSDHALGA